MSTQEDNQGEGVTEAPKELKIARCVVCDAYEPDSWLYWLRGQILRKVDIEGNYWDVYRVNPDNPHELVDTINADAVSSARSLLSMLSKYPGTESAEDPQEREKGPSMVY
ncbi:hypothetical protein CP556_25075 [Natrinema sp. CBA1119]|uniref:hypothetical protein n=1 Tax=Natrinema sp. CBA1119 TaxID=1608465 RepID=UPI000BF51E5F|nr:hypothetical protein [Natrinema sp. CBA1119]PGF13804.1 hypothetical protein CP556_25075 [Natrinema sp. CBA1119]